MTEVNGNVMHPDDHTRIIDGNRRYAGSYSFHRLPSGGWGLFRDDTKIAAVHQMGDEGRQIAYELTSAMNARERYLSNKDFNKMKHDN